MRRLISSMRIFNFINHFIEKLLYWTHTLHADISGTVRMSRITHMHESNHTHSKQIAEVGAMDNFDLLLRSAYLWHDSFIFVTCHIHIFTLKLRGLLDIVVITQHRLDLKQNVGSKTDQER